MDREAYRRLVASEDPETAARMYIADVARALFEDSPEGEAAEERTGIMVKAFRDRPFADGLVFYRVLVRHLRDLERRSGTASIMTLRSLTEHFYKEVLG